VTSFTQSHLNAFGSFSLDEEFVQGELMNWDYVAGFFDGEGNICRVQKGKMATCYLRFSNKDRMVLEKIREFLQVGYFTLDKKKGVSHLVIGGHKKVLRIAEELAPRCVIKKLGLEDLICFIKGRQWKNDTGLYVVSREELYKLYWEKQLSILEIAKIFDRDRKSVEHKMTALGIPRRSLSEALKIAWSSGRKTGCQGTIL
jgi:hypothetical protein